MTRSLARDSIFFTGTVSSKRDLIWECWDSASGVRRGVVVVVSALDVLLDIFLAIGGFSRPCYQRCVLNFRLSSQEDTMVDGLGLANLC